MRRRGLGIQQPRTKDQLSGIDYRVSSANGRTGSNNAHVPTPTEQQFHVSLPVRVSTWWCRMITKIGSAAAAFPRIRALWFQAPYGVRPHHKKSNLHWLCNDNLPALWIPRIAILYLCFDFMFDTEFRPSHSELIRLKDAIRQWGSHQKLSSLSRVSVDRKLHAAASQPRTISPQPLSPPLPTNHPFVITCSEEGSLQLNCLPLATMQIRWLGQSFNVLPP